MQALSRTPIAEPKNPTEFDPSEIDDEADCLALPHPFENHALNLHEHASFWRDGKRLVALDMNGDWWLVETINGRAAAELGFAGMTAKDYQEARDALIAACREWDGKDVRWLIPVITRVLAHDASAEDSGYGYLGAEVSDALDSMGGSWPEDLSDTCDWIAIDTQQRALGRDRRGWALETFDMAEREEEDEEEE